MQKVKLFDHRMNDGSRNFADASATVGFTKMREHLRALSGAREVNYLSDNVTEMSLDFDYVGHRFSINNQVGDYWLFVDDPETSEPILLVVAEHFAQINRQ